MGQLLLYFRVLVKELTSRGFVSALIQTGGFGDRTESRHLHLTYPRHHNARSLPLSHPEDRRYLLPMFGSYGAHSAS